MLSGKGYALKVIQKSQLRKSKEKVKQLINEVSIAKRIQHENIIRFYAHFEDALKLYLVLELVEEGNLFQQLKKRGPFDER